MSESLARTALPLRAILAGSLERDWNEVLPRLYEKASMPAAWMIGMHFFAGSAFHRWTGRVYVVSALAAGVGGVTYLLLKGAVGGPVWTSASACMDC